MRIFTGYLWAVFSVGLFVFTLPSAMESTHYWVAYFSRVHAVLLSAATTIAGSMPAAPEGLAEASFWRTAAAPFLFWPHLLFLLLLLGMSIGLSNVAAYYLPRNYPDDVLLPAWRRSFIIIWFIYVFFGPKLTLHATYPEMGELRLLEPIFKTIGRTPDPSIAIYLSQLYILSALLVVFVLAMALPISWLKYKAGIRVR